MNAAHEEKSKPMFTYVEVVERKTNRVIERIDVSGDSDSRQERVQRGLNINLNHREYRSRIASYLQSMPREDKA